jgi:hypothetical protein
MKRFAAFILSIVYMAFTLSAMGYSHGNAVYTHAVSTVDDGCSDEAASTCTAHFDATGQFKKAPKHPAPSGKIKIPRPGFVNITIADRQLNASAISTTYPNATEIRNSNLNDLYLKNRMLLI